MTDITMESTAVSAIHAVSIEGSDADVKRVSSGYCGGCGTWAAHHFTCTFCGYDFEGDTESFAPED